MNTRAGRIGTTISILAAIALAGCAAAPERTADIERARDTITQVASMPEASTVAGAQLKEAQDSLDRAEEAAAVHRPYDEVAHLAYMAEQQAHIAEAKLREAHAQERIDRAQAARNAALLDAREREAAQAQQRAATAEAAAAAAAASADEAWRQLQEAKETDRGVVLTLGDVLFDTGKAELKPGAQLILDRLAGYLESNPSTRVIIEGHTDNVGSIETNRELSEERAESVATALRSRGIAPDRMEAVGLGESYPVASNDSAAGRVQNRRVEVVLSDETGTFRDNAHRTVSNLSLDSSRSAN